ncbi:MAG: hypothetical protein ACLR23_26880 [Clostridia bacterium]
MPAGEGSHKRSRRGEGKKRGQRRGAGQRKCPPVRESQEEPAWRKGERGPEERARPKKMPAGEGSHKRSRRGERGEKRPEKGAGPRKCPPVEKVTRGSGVEKGEKRGQRRWLAQENARR